MSRFNEIIDERVDLFLTNKIWLKFHQMAPINPRCKRSKEIADRYNELTEELKKLKEQNDGNKTTRKTISVRVI